MKVPQTTPDGNSEEARTTAAPGLRIHERQVHGRYLSDVLPALPDQRILAIAGDLGCGKTTCVAQQTMGQPVVAVVHRVSLTHGLATKLGAVCYDAVGSPHERRDRAVKEERYATTIHSLHLAEGRDWSKVILIIDEFTQVLRTLVGDKAIKPKHRRQVARVFFEALRNAGQVILLDAFIRPAHLKLLAMVAGLEDTDAVFIDNTFVQPRGCAYQIANVQALRQLAVSGASLDERLFYTSSTQAGACAAVEAFRAEGIKPLLIESRTSQSPAAKVWAENPGDPDGPAVVVASPSVTSGVSADVRPDGSPAYQYVYHEGHRHELHMDDHLQQLARVRGKPTLFWWMSTPREQPSAPRAAVERFHEAQRDLEFTMRAAARVRGISGPPDMEATWDESLAKLRAWLDADRECSMVGGAKTFAKRLEAMGWQVQRRPARKMTDEEKVARDAQVAAARKRILETTIGTELPPDDPEDKDALQEWRDLPADVRARGELALKVREVLKLGRDDLEWDEAEDFAWGLLDGGCRTLKMAARALLTDFAIEVDLRQLGYAYDKASFSEPTEEGRTCWFYYPDCSRVHLDLEHAETRHRLFERGIEQVRLGRSPHTTRVGSNAFTADDLEAWGAWARKNGGLLRRHLHVQAPKKDSSRGPTRAFATFVGRFGLQVVPAGKLTVDGRRANVYRVELHPQVLRAFQRRGLLTSARFRPCIEGLVPGIAGSAQEEE